MKQENLPLIPTAPGLLHSLQVLRFGTAGTGPKAFVQAAVHADEVPGMLVAQQLKILLRDLEERGQLEGEVVLVPYANPLGLSQSLLGTQIGRFDLNDGINFNRAYPDLSASIADTLGPRLGHSLQENRLIIRQLLREAAFALTAVRPSDDLKNRLLQLAIDADVVLDLHCDQESVMHVYALTPQVEIAAELGTLLGAKALLLATHSGDNPFDEACSVPWSTLRELFPDHPIDLACFSATVELRGLTDTSHELARQDAQALIEFLRRRGVIKGPCIDLPPPRFTPTPLAACEPLVSPVAGVVVFIRQLGESLQAGDHVADLIDPGSGAIEPIHCQSAGLLFARTDKRWARPGMRLGKVAGTQLQRTGKLLSP
jgi:predicted deacylase